MKKLTSNEIRNIWLKFFKDENHKIIPSKSLIPVNDKSLLWINSGVATLKHYFDGTQTPPSKRMANVQKAIRTGDIDNVGITTRHHTFFEMLGNFSIGDYFKKEAIQMAWDLLTNKKWLGIDENLLYITIFEEDTDALKFWKEVGVKDDKIFKMGRDTNFWDMGKGPSGPSTEIFFDKGEKFNSHNAKELIEKDIENDRYVEIWNIVFSEFNNDGKGNYTKLPQRNIDTGAGLERIVSILQNKPSNFETDLFVDLIKTIESKTNSKYLWDYIPSKLKKDNNNQFVINSYFKSIADFSRSVCFAISDGATPGPTGRGYVIRKLIRKAVINKSKLNINENFIHELVDPLIKIMGDHYPLLKEKRETIISIIKTEEEQFNKTLTNVKIKFNVLLKENKLNEKEAFKLHETYGMPLDVLKDIVSSSDKKLDWKKVENLNDDFKNNSRKNRKDIDVMNIQDEEFNNLPETKFVGYDLEEEIGEVIFVKDNKVVFDKTPFYATSGGQESDFGYADSNYVSYVKKNSNKTFIHTIDDNNFKIGDKVKLSIDSDRRRNMKMNHSGAHLLFRAMEIICGKKISQQGSKVEVNFLRFDFSMQNKIDDDKWNEIEKLVNKWIKDSTSVSTTIKNNEEAQKIINISRMDNHNYGNKVRVVKMNDEVIDFCTGTHVSNTKDIEELKLIKYEKKGSGIFRVEAITGKENIVNTFEKINSNIEKEILIPLISKINSFNLKLKELDIKNSIDFKKELNLLDLKNPTYKKDVNNLKEKFNNEIKEKGSLIEKSLNLMIDNEFKNTNIFIKEFFEISIQDINKQLLNSIDNTGRDIAITIINNSKKTTLGVVIAKKNINDNLINKIKLLAEKNGLKGNGNNQQYVFGGNKIDIDKLINEVKTWEF